MVLLIRAELTYASAGGAAGSWLVIYYESALAHASLKIQQACSGFSHE